MKPAVPQNYVQTKHSEEPYTLAHRDTSRWFVCNVCHVSSPKCYAIFSFGLNVVIHNVRHTLGSM